MWTKSNLLPIVINVISCTSLLFSIINLSSTVGPVNCRGVAVFGKSSGKPFVPIESDRQHFIWAVVGLATVILIFLSLCFCRCYYRYKEITDEKNYHRNLKEQQEQTRQQHLLHQQQTSKQHRRSHSPLPQHHQIKQQQHHHHHHHHDNHHQTETTHQHNHHQGPSKEERKNSRASELRRESTSRSSV